MIVLDSGDKIRGDATSSTEVDYTIYGLDNNALKQLADGQLASSIGDLYTSDSTDVATSIILVNTGAAHNHVNLYLTPASGTARRLIPKDLQLEPGYSLYFDGIKCTVLDASGAILQSMSTKLDDLGSPDDNIDLDASTTTHGLLLKATAPAAGLVNVVGIENGETAYEDKPLFDATVPETQAFSDAAATGTATVSARRDHKHGMPASPSPASTVLKALTEIQMVAADIVSVTTCTDNATFYEPALQARLTSNAVYKRYISVKVSAQSNTAGTISIELRNVTAGTSGTAVTVVIAGGQENVEKAIAATTVTAVPTTLGDVFTIRVKHSVNGATVTLNSGGIMEADQIANVTATGYQDTYPTLPCYVSSWKFVAMAGLSTATITVQPVCPLFPLVGGSTFYYSNIYSSSSTLNSSVTIAVTNKFYNGTTAAYHIQLNVIALSGQALLGQALGYSVDNI